ncbi:MAG: DUF1439 domain-containing protein [Polaromonas sp.]
MKRRQWLTTFPLALALAAASAQAQPSHTVTTAQLQQAVAEKFPMRYPVGGLLELTLQPPRLRLLPEQNRLGTHMVVDAAGAALSRPTTGNFDVDFALRYEPSDQSIRAHKLKVNTLSLSGMPPGPAALLQAYGPSLAEQSLLEVVLHKLQPKDLALTDGLGLEPGAITVTARGLVIAFVPKKTL